MFAGVAVALPATGPAILADIVPAERRGKVYGSSLGAIYAGLTLGPVCAGMLMTAMLISHSIGNDPVAQHPLTFVETMLTAFWLLAALSVLALGVSLTPRTRARG
jgi:MFS family permease